MNKNILFLTSLSIFSLSLYSMEFGRFTYKSNTERRDALREAVYRDDVRAVQLVLTTLGASASSAVRATDNEGRTALMEASKKGNVDMVKALIEGAGYASSVVKAADKYGRTALMEASKQGNVGVVKALIEGAGYASSMVKAADKDGITALMQASSNGHYEIVSLLLDHGADRKDLLKPVVNNANVQRNQSADRELPSSRYKRKREERAEFEQESDNGEKERSKKRAKIMDKLEKCKDLSDIEYYRKKFDKLLDEEWIAFNKQALKVMEKIGKK